MAEFRLPKNSRVEKGKEYIQSGCNISDNDTLKVLIYRYNPDLGNNPRIDIFYIKQDKSINMVLDLLIKIKNENYIDILSL